MAEQLLPPSFQQFRRPAPDQQARARPSPYPGIKGTLPVEPGTAIRMTPMEERELGKLGLKPGEAVPANLAEAVAAARLAAKDVGHLLPVDPGTPPLDYDERPIEALPPDKRQELMDAIRQMQASEQHFQAMPAIVGPEGRNPSLMQAMRVAAEAPTPFIANRAEAPGDPVSAFRRQQGAAAPEPPDPGYDRRGLVPDAGPLKSNSPGPATPPQFFRVADPQQAEQLGAAMAENESLRRKVAELERALEAAASQLPPPGGASDSGAVSLGNCQHCGWSLAQPDEIAPSPTDKYEYLAAILGGPRARYRREASLFGGAVRCTFRSLTTEENDMVYRQITADSRDGRLASENDVYLKLMDYRLALTLERLEHRAGVPGLALHQVPEAAAVPPDPGDPTPLPVLDRFVRGLVLPSETLQRAVRQEFHRFNKYVEKLEANASNPDFWAGTASPA
jgi:hypothetical protein